MTEAPANLSVDELLKRIIRLERMNAALQHRLDELDSAFQSEVASTTDHITYLYQRNEDYLWPLVHKVFPGYARAMEQGTAILRPRPSREDEQG